MSLYLFIEINLNFLLVFSRRMLHLMGLRALGVDCNSSLSEGLASPLPHTRGFLGALCLPHWIISYLFIQQILQLVLVIKAVSLFGKIVI